MLNFNLLKNLLVIAIAVSTVTVIFIQKTKRFLPTSKLIPVYSLFINILCGYFFSKTFTTDINNIEAIWIGLFAFLGADTIYTSLEGKIAPFSELNNKTDDIIGSIPHE